MAAIAIRYELQVLEDFVRHEYAIAETNLPVASGKFKKWEQFAGAELKRIKGNMTVQVLSIAKPRHIELYIQHHQAGIIQLSETLQQLKNGYVSKPGRPWLDFYNYLQLELQTLLEFLKHYFEAYFDWHQIIPTFRRGGSVACTFRLYLEYLEGFGDGGSGLILQMIRQYWEPIAGGIDSGLTFHRERYFDMLFRALSTRQHSRISNKELVELLLQLNYNDTRFMDYCRMEMVASLARLEDTAVKLQFLARRIKQLKQIPLPKMDPFNPSNPGIVTYCRHWMEEEYQFLQQSSRLSGVEAMQEPPGSPGLKLQTNLSVAQLGILLQLMYKSGSMKLKNKTAFINFFAQHVVTRGGAVISGKNLRNSYYNIDFKAKEGVKETLYEMLKMLRETD